MEKSLNKKYYFSDQIFGQELENIFYSDWICCGREEDIESAGSYQIFKIGNENLFVIKDKSNEIRVFHNFCKHRGCQILEDETSSPLKRNIRCPYHSWVYNFDGSLYKAPHLEVDNQDKKFNLNQVRSESWGGFIFINLDSHPSSFKDYIKNIQKQFQRYPLCDVVSSRSYKYKVSANWKVIVENYNECYHCAGVHPELCNVVPAFKENGADQLDWENGIPHRPGANTFTFSGKTDREPFPGLNQSEKNNHFGQALYPNLMMSFSMDHVAAFILRPISPSLTEIDCRILFHPNEIDKSDFNPDDASEFWDLVNKQDWDICERVQKGMQSKAFEYGYYAPMEDESLDIRKYIGKRLGVSFD